MLIRVDLLHQKPGRRQDLIDLVKKTAPLMEKHGGANVRLMQSFVPAQGLIYGTIEYENLSALAAAQKSMQNDDAIEELLQRGWTTEDSPVTGVTRMLLRHVQSFGAPEADFSAVLIRQVRVKPGRMDDFLDVAKKAGSVMAEYGGRNHVSVPVLGGVEGGPNAISAGRFPDLNALAAFVDGVPENETMQQVVATMTASDAPADGIQFGIATRIPL